MAKASRETLIAWELEKVRQLDPNKHLRPRAVVDYARSHKGSILHKEFEWDIEKAAMGHWLTRARHLIKINVTMLPDAKTGEFTVVSPSFVSLPADRGTGYRPIGAVLTNPPTRDDMLQYLVQRFLSVKQAWIYPELNEVTAAIDRAAKKYLRSAA